MKYIVTLFMSALFSTLLYYATVFSLYPAPIAAEYWIRQMIDVKLDIVAKHDETRKIVIAGGSSTLFGIDTTLLSRDLNIPVINLGLHAGLSLDTILKTAKQSVQTGDILILELEPPYYYLDFYPGANKWSVRNMIAWNAAAWETLGIREKITAINIYGMRLIPDMIKARWLLLTNPSALDKRLAALNKKQTLANFNPNLIPDKFAYSAFQLDALGNMKLAIGSKYTGKPEFDPENMLEPTSQVLAKLEYFIRGLHMQGVDVYFANTPYLKVNVLDKHLIALNFDKFQKHLSRLAPFIDRREDLIFERQYFFNTYLHLNNNGRYLNTQRLEKVIKSYILKSSSSPANRG